MNTNTVSDVRFSTTAKNLLNQLIGKQISLDGFLRECAYWALREGFDELRPHPLPTPPDTNAFKEFEALPKQKRDNVDPVYFRNNPEILSYYTQVNFIKSRNAANLFWLKEIKSYLKNEDELLLGKIAARIMEFNAWFDDNPVIVEKIKKTFDARNSG